MIVNRVEQHIIKENNVNWLFIDNMCLKSKNLYNYANYIIRQEFIKNNTICMDGSIWSKMNQMLLTRLE